MSFYSNILYYDTHLSVSGKCACGDGDNSWRHAEYLENTHVHVLCLCYDLTSSKWSNTWPFFSIMRSSVTSVFFLFFFLHHCQSCHSPATSFGWLQKWDMEVERNGTVMLSVLTQCTRIWHLTWELLCLKHPLNNNSVIKSHHSWKNRNVVYCSSLTIHLNVFN